VANNLRVKLVVRFVKNTDIHVAEYRLLCVEIHANDTTLKINTGVVLRRWRNTKITVL